MKKTRVGKWIAAIGASLTFLFAFLFSVGGGILTGLPNDGESETENPISVAEAATITYPSASSSNGFGQFSAGYSYTFTDKELAEGYHNGSRNTDLTTVKVSGSATHGTQANPFVISTVDDWKNFAKYAYSSGVATTANATNGKYFVLANDIDFTNKTFYPIPYFYGTFYGTGHKLQNISVTSWKFYNDSALNTHSFGVFCYNYASTIADLIVENFSYQNMPQVFALEAQSRGTNTGGIVGMSIYDCYYLNCHASGSFASTTAYGMHMPVGGIVGWSYSGRTSPRNKTFFYRCSADTTSSLKTRAATDRVIILGGLLGEDYFCGKDVTVLDCAANVKQTTTSGNYGFYMSSLVGISGSNSRYVIDGFVGSLDVTSETNTREGNYSGSLMGLFASTSTEYAGKGFTIDVKNCYSDSILRLPSGNKSQYAISGSHNNTMAAANFKSSNVNYSAPYAYCVFASGCSNYATQGQTYSSSGALYTAAKGAVGTDVSSALKSKIWIADRIGGKYDPDNSPVRNYLTIVPKDVEVEYTGEQAVITNEEWFLESIHGNPDIMTIVYPSGGMINANASGYNVTFTLKEGYTWNDGTKSSKTIKVVVKPKKLSISWDTSNGPAVAKISGGLVAKDVGNPPEIINTYYEENGTEVAGGVPDTIGTYKVKATIAEGSNYKLKDNETDPDPETTFQLTAIPIKTPTVSGNASQMYTGEDIVFTLANTDQMGPKDEGFKIEADPYEVSSGATYKRAEDGTRTITVKQVGTYTVKFALHDQTNNCWADGTGVLRLTVTQRPLILTVESGKNWTFETNTNESFTVTHNAVSAADNIQLAISYFKPNGEEITVGSDKMKTDAENAKKTVVTLDPLDAGKHTIRVGLAAATASNANRNYKLTSNGSLDNPIGFIEQDIQVNGKTVVLQDGDIVWQYSDGSTSGLFSEVGNKLSYNGRTVTASIKTEKLAEKGVRVKEYAEDGEYSSTGLNAGSYKSKVTLTALNETYNFTDKDYEIAWQITQAKFNLTNVKWSYTEPIGYTGSMITVQLTNVPSALTATYIGNRQIEVSKGEGGYNATVQFKLKNSAEASNYILPQSNDNTTYVYPDGETFPWQLEWRIKKGVILAAWDLDGEDAVGKNGFEFIYPVLSGGGNYVEYEFYQVIGGVTATDPTPIGQIEDPGDKRTAEYIVRAVLKDNLEAQNFEFSGGEEPEMKFTIGDFRYPVNVTVTKSGGMYSGEAMPIAFTSDLLTPADFVVTYLDMNGIKLDGAPVNAGTYTARISVVDSKSGTYYVKNRSHEIVIEKFKIETGDLKWNYDSTNPPTFTRNADGTETFYTVELAGLPSTLPIVYTQNSFSAAGEYTATAAFGDTSEIDTDNIDLSNFEYDSNTSKYLLPASVRTLNWKIEKHTLTKPVSPTDKITYDGTGRDLVKMIGLDADWAQYLTLSVKRGTTVLDGTDYTVENAGTYTITCTPIGSLRNSVVWSDKTTIDVTVRVKIDPLYIKVVGWEGKPAAPLFEGGVGESYYKVVYKIVDGDGNETVLDLSEVERTFNKDIYASVAVSDSMEGNLYIDYDEAVETTCKFRLFEGEPRLLDRPVLVKEVLEYNFDSQEFFIKGWKDIRDYVTLLGEHGENSPLVVESDFIGTRIVKVALKSDQNVAWKGERDKRLEIVELVIEVVAGTLPQDWDVDENGRPILSFADMEEGLFDWSTLVEYEYYDEDDTPVRPNKLKEGVSYKVVATIKEDYKDYFCFGKTEDGELKASSGEYKFTFGETDEPTPPDPEGPGTIIPGPSENTNQLPLWQLIVGGISAILFVVCSAKAFGEYGKYKAAKKEAKELAQVSYSVTYGFAPLPLLAIAFLGLGETPWTVIAFVALGLFLVSLAALLMLSKKRKAAELAVKREQARIEEEKEYARQDEQLRREEQIRAEQQRRDEEFKMMFAAMQQQNSQQPQFGYDDMQNLIASTVTALLPGLQQSMQALPPAQAPDQYAAPAPAPDPYGAPQYGAPAPQYAAPSSEADALRAQMAAQQEQMAQQQAQMAQQQELINQLLQNQQAQQSAPAAAPVQEEAFWTVEGEEIVSLEELYGKLSDDAKRGYYEIGSYIMNKPQTSQNDGKYAVLFKYRGKTLFKLCIKNDAPVLYYPADNGGRAEVLIVDAAALQVAKSIVDVHIAKTDSEMA